MGKEITVIYNYMSIERFERFLSTTEWALSNVLNSNDPKERRSAFMEKAKGNDLPAFSCFSRVYNNPMMWHFYGGAGTGVCIGFDLAEMKAVLGDSIDIHPLDYYDLKEEGGIEAKACFKGETTLVSKLKYKLKEWEPEQEVRIFFDLEECQSKLVPDYPIGEKRDVYYLRGMLRFVKELYLGEHCILKHFMSINNRKNSPNDKLNTMKLPKTDVYNVRSHLDGSISSAFMAEYPPLEDLIRRVSSDEDCCLSVTTATIDGLKNRNDIISEK